MSRYNLRPPSEQQEPRTSYEVRAYIEVPTCGEAEHIAQRWVADVGGEGLVYRRRTWPWLRIEQMRRFGTRR